MRRTTTMLVTAVAVGLTACGGEAKPEPAYNADAIPDCLKAQGYEIPEDLSTGDRLPIEGGGDGSKAVANAYDVGKYSGKEYTIEAKVRVGNLTGPGPIKLERSSGSEQFFYASVPAVPRTDIAERRGVKFVAFGPTGESGDTGPEPFTRGEPSAPGGWPGRQVTTGVYTFADADAAKRAEKDAADGDRLLAPFRAARPRNVTAEQYKPGFQPQPKRTVPLDDFEVETVAERVNPPPGGFSPPPSKQVLLRLLKRAGAPARPWRSGNVLVLTYVAMPTEQRAAVRAALNCANKKETDIQAVF